MISNVYSPLPQRKVFKSNLTHTMSGNRRAIKHAPLKTMISKPNSKANDQLVARKSATRYLAAVFFGFCLFVFRVAVARYQ